MFAHSHKLRVKSMNFTNQTTHRTEVNTIKYTLPTIVHDDNGEEDQFWKNIQVTDNVLLGLVEIRWSSFRNFSIHKIR